MWFTPSYEQQMRRLSCLRTIICLRTMNETVSNTNNALWSCSSALTRDCNFVKQSDICDTDSLLLKHDDGFILSRKIHVQYVTTLTQHFNNLHCAALIITLTNPNQIINRSNSAVVRLWKMDRIDQAITTNADSQAGEQYSTELFQLASASP